MADTTQEEMMDFFRALIATTGNTGFVDEREDGLNTTAATATSSTKAKAPRAPPATPMATKYVGLAQSVQWQTDADLKIALRLVYSSEYASQLDHPQKKADVWNRVVKDIKTIRDRNVFVPEQTMSTQYSEHDRPPTIPSRKDWKDIMKIKQDDPKWVGMKQRFDEAIAELDSSNGWSKVLMVP